MRLNFRQIEAFRAVFDTCSMTAGANLMGITQQAASRLIRDLEAETGLSLFERQGRGLVATEEAHALNREVQRSFLGLEQITRAAESIARRRPGALRIAASAAPSLHLLPEVVDQYRLDWPDVALSLNMLPSLEVVDTVGRQHDDIGVADVPSDGRGVDLETFAGLNFVCALPAKHPLAQKRTIKPKDLGNASLLMVSPASHHYQRIMEAFHAARVEPRIIFESSNSGPLRALAARDAGIAILDPITAALGGGQDVLVRRFSPAISYDLCLIYPAKRPVPDQVRSFAEAMRRHVQRLRKLVPA